MLAKIIVLFILRVSSVAVVCRTLADANAINRCVPALIGKDSANSRVLSHSAGSLGNIADEHDVLLPTTGGSAWVEHSIVGQGLSISVDEAIQTSSFHAS
jgi:hypothetical protein